jgi:hypothetical protein
MKQTPTRALVLSGGGSLLRGCYVAAALLSLGSQFGSQATENA